MLEKTLAKSNRIKPVSLLIGLSAYLLLLLVPPPPLLGQVLYRPAWPTFALLCVFFALLLRQTSPRWEAVQSGFVFALFSMPLIHTWQFAQQGGEIIGGLLPWSDAADFTWETQRLMNGLLLTTWGARRPLFPGFLAVLLRMNGGDFMRTLILLTLVNALAVFLSVGLIKRLYGAAASAIFLVFAYTFYARFAGKTLTEQLGFALGNLAFFFLLAGAYQRYLWQFLLGIGLLGLGLNARAGAFFILPFLAVWAAYYFRQKIGFWRTFGLMVAAVVLAFALNLAVLKSIAVPQGIPFSNFSHTLYGLASGNKGWSYIYQDHPNVNESDIMSLAIEKIRSDPILLIQGMIGSFHDFFTPDFGAFGFFPGVQYQTWINTVLWGLASAGLACSLSKWKEGTRGLVLASFMGVVSSLALLPPRDADGMRAFAATIPFTALWVLSGFSVLSNWLGRWFLGKEKEAVEEMEPHGYCLALGFSVLLILLMFPAPILVREMARPAAGSSPSSTALPCKPGHELLQNFHLENMVIILTDNDAVKESYMPFIRLGDFREAIRKNTYSYLFLDEELRHLQAGDRLSLGLNLDPAMPYGNIYLASKFPLEGGIIRACGTVTQDEKLRPYGYYYLDGAPVHPASLTFSQQNPKITLALRLIYGAGAGLVSLLLVMHGLAFKGHSILNYLCALGVMLLILQGVFTALYAQAVLYIPYAEQRIRLDSRLAVLEKGNLYMLPLGINWMSQADLGSSPVTVYENGTRLQFPNSEREAIRDEGNGRYSIWEGYLYFSSSDNTDPRVNGRTYELEWPHPIHPALQWISYLTSLIGIAVLFFRTRLMLLVGTWFAGLNRRTASTGK